MERYTLTDEGRWRFRRMRIEVNLGKARMEGYEVLEYLYDNGSGTVEEMVSNSGLSWVQVTHKLSTFIHRGLVEKLVEL